MLVPQRWLVALAAAVLVPWLISSALGFRRVDRERPVSDDQARIPPGPVTLGSLGPWGQLEMASIVISPPLEYVPEDPDPPQQIRWSFPRATREEVESFLAAAGVGEEPLRRLLSTARVEPRIAGVVLAPDRDIVASLDPHTRARVYLRLGDSPLNPRHENAFRFFGASVDDWLGPASLPPESLSLVKPLAYSHEGFVYFADIDLVRSQLGDGPQMRRLTKALFRESTFLVRLRLGPSSNIDGVVEYWGRGGRATDVRPLLESAAAVGPEYAIDVAHLLPTFARLHLYRYPQITLTDFDRPGLVNCFWTALNFFNRKPEDRYLDLDAVTTALKRDYYLVHDRFQLGDIAVFTDGNGNLYHAAVYVADGLIFGKNGASSLSPWTLQPIERLKGYYPQHADGGRIRYYRRKDL